jgi:hypothetical protein
MGLCDFSDEVRVYDSSKRKENNQLIIKNTISQENPQIEKLMCVAVLYLNFVFEFE